MNRQQQAIQYDRQVLAYARRMRPQYLRVLSSQLGAVTRWLREYPATDPPIDILVAYGRFTPVITNGYRTISVLAARREYQGQKKVSEKATWLEFLVDKWTKAFLEYASRYAPLADYGLTETSRRLIRETLQRARLLRYDQEKLIRYMQSQVSELNAVRATTIARTETGAQAMYGRMNGAGQYFSETGERGYKWYLGREDSRERPSHVALNETIIPMDENFRFELEGGGYEQAPYPLSPNLSAENRVNCRCSITFMPEREYLARLAGDRFV